ncbi:hypothetical protein CSUI_011442, partial [Cystoisospora suis]
MKEDLLVSSSRFLFLFSYHSSFGLVDQLLLSIHPALRRSIDHAGNDRREKVHCCSPYPSSSSDLPASFSPPFCLLKSWVVIIRTLF